MGAGGLVQFVFASPARPPPVCAPRRLCAPRRQAKDALNYHILLRRSGSVAFAREADLGTETSDSPDVSMLGQ